MVGKQSNVLHIDIDIKLHDFEEFKPYWLRAVKTILKSFGYKVVDVVIRESSSGNTHIWVHLDRPVPEELRPFLQFLAYSDPKREVFNLKRLRTFGRTYSVLFAKKRKVKFKLISESNQSSKNTKYEVRKNDKLDSRVYSGGLVGEEFKQA